MEIMLPQRINIKNQKSEIYILSINRVHLFHERKRGEESGAETA